MRVNASERSLPPVPGLLAAIATFLAACVSPPNAAMARRPAVVPAASKPRVPLSECSGIAGYQGIKTRDKRFAYRAAAYAGVGCLGPVIYSCRARIQANLAGRWTTVAKGAFNSGSLGRTCQSPTRTRGGFVRGRWRIVNTYQLVRLDNAIWWPPTKICSGGTRVSRCTVRRTFRGRQSGTVRLTSGL